MGALKSLPKWAKIAISTFISVIVIGAMLASIVVPGLLAIIVSGIIVIDIYLVVAFVYDVLFGE